MGASPWYATRESVAAALNISATAALTRQIDNALDAGVEKIHGDLHIRHFWPEYATRTFDWPDRHRGVTGTLYLGPDVLISATSVLNGGVALPASDYYLRPDTGPPYKRIEIDRTSSSAFSGVGQRALAITGLWGWSDQEMRDGSLETSLTDSATTVDVTDGGGIGVGSLLRVDTERMLVTERELVDTGINTAGALTLSDADRALVVADGTQFHSWEELVIDSERMMVQAVAGNTLIVKRAVSGSVLAAHSLGADIYAMRRLTVQRGAVGSTAAAHADAAEVYQWLAPGLIEQLHRAEAIVSLSQEGAGYAADTASGQAARDTPGPGIDQLRWDAYTRYGRKARKTAI